jgi:hypothetical protein
MAKQTNNKGEVTLWSKAKWQGFVNVSMTQEEKRAVKAGLMGEGDGFEFLMNAATAGYKCSISYSIAEDVYTVSLTGQYQEKPNAGITMSMRHRELMVALSALRWCHEEAGQSGDWQDRYTLSGTDNW